MKYLMLIILLTLSVSLKAADSYIVGEVTDITTYPGGLLLRVGGNQKPSGCTQTSAWMVIPEQNKTMISVALAMYMSDKRKAVIYVDTTSTGYYCKIVQYDPQN